LSADLKSDRTGSDAVIFNRLSVNPQGTSLPKSCFHDTPLPNLGRNILQNNMTESFPKK
jgi:hypothetical protein